MLHLFINNITILYFLFLLMLILFIIGNIIYINTLHWRNKTWRNDNSPLILSQTL